jgi:hypothetical protein
LAEHADEGVPTVLSRARIGKKITGRWRQSESIVEFAIRQQTGIGGHDGATKLHHDAAVEIESKDAVFGFTRRVRHVRLTWCAQITGLL